MQALHYTTIETENIWRHLRSTLSSLGYVFYIPTAKRRKSHDLKYKLDTVDYGDFNKFW